MLGFGLPAFWARDVRGEMGNWLGEEYTSFNGSRVINPFSTE
jgi:hypothetical protein